MKEKKSEKSLKKSDTNNTTNDSVNIPSQGEVLGDIETSKQIVLEKLGFGNNIGATPDDIEFLYDKIKEMTLDRAIEILQQAVEYHNGDVNFPKDAWNRIQAVLQNEKEHDTIEKEYSLDAKIEACLIHYHSPYPEVRSVTEPYDDPNMPCETFRAYLIGIIWSIIGAGLNTFFVPRMPNVSLGNPVIQVLSYPCGLALAAILPDWGFKFRGKRQSLNPSPWTYKEQMFSTIIFSVANGGAYAAIYNIFVQKLDVYYGDKWATIGFQILLVVSTQFIGFGFAGIMRRLVVYPVRALWPTLLPVIALNRALTKLEKKENINGWTLSRYKYFFIVFFGVFLYFWIPNYLFEALSNFNWMCWIKPDNFALNVITGMNNMGINPIPTFDLNIITYNNPLALPFYTQANQYIGVIIAGGIIIPALYWTNYRWVGYLPINTNKLYDNKGELFDVKKVLTNGLLDEQKYQAYSPPYYTAASILTYGAFFALYPYAIIETFLLQWNVIIDSFKDVFKSVFKKKRTSNFEGHGDPHSRMMAKYHEIPDWWFIIILIIALVFGILAVELYPTNTPVWGIFFALGINFIFLIPITIIYSVTGFSFGLNVLVELIVGLALPGNGTALMILKAFGYNIDGQAQNYITDQKMGQYAKIPPLALFKGQLIATVFQCFVCLGVVNWQLSNIKDICQPHQESKFTCPATNTYFSSSIIWGIIGPKVTFKHIYPALKWAFLIGAVAPFFVYILRRRFPEPFKYVHPTLVFGGMIIYAPYSAAYYTGGLYLGWLFMYYLRYKYLQWWEKYNYVTYSAISAGIGLSALIIFFAVQYHPKELSWWGNNVSGDTIDGGGRHPQALFKIPEDPGYFGFPPGHYPSHKD